jgi:DNA-binding transcriptional ArsR family regulator
VQLVDLRRPRSPGEPRLLVWASPAAELLRALATLVDDELEGFDVGTDRLVELRSRLPEPLLRELRALLPAGRHWLLISSIVAALPEPGEVDDLLALLDDDPGAVWRMLVAGHVEDDDRRLAEAVRTGETDLAPLRAALGQLEDEAADAVRELIDLDPVRLGTDLRRLLAAFSDAIGADMVAEALGPMQRETAARRAQHAAGTPIRRLVVEATNGYELGEGLSSERVLLLPSYWFRPWLIIARHDDAEVFTTPIADEHLALPSQAPPPTLVKLFKALGDEGRLRLLRRMACGAIALSDAMEELDVAKTTAHHHLSILRQAGLVTVRDQGRSKLYGLRQDPPATAASALEEYVGPVARTVLAGGE